VTAWEPYLRYLNALGRRVRGGGPPPDADECARLRELHAAADEEWQRTHLGPPPYPHLGERPQSWELLAAELGCPQSPAPAPVEEVSADERSGKRKRSGKGKRVGRSYDVKVVASVIRRAVELDEKPRRELRDRWYREVPGATTPLIEHILGLMRGKPLPVIRRKRWEQAADRMADDGTVTLAELTQRLG
jgi:hypothetical protein